MAATVIFAYMQWWTNQSDW